MLKIGHTLFPMKAHQVQEYQKYQSGQKYDKKWLHATSKSPYFKALNGTKMYIVEQEETKTKLPDTLSGKVVENGGGFYAIKLKVSGNQLFDAALSYISEQASGDLSKLDWNPPKSWTAYGKKPLGPHVSLTAASGQAHLGEHIEIKLKGWKDYVDGSTWVVLKAKLPKGLSCPYNDCHVSCAQGTI